MYFSRINNPNQLRKEVLLATKESIILLSRQKKSEDIKIKKGQLCEEINSTLNEIHKQIKNLDEILPNKELKKEPLITKKQQVKKEIEKPKLKKFLPQESKEQQITDLDRLDYTLKKIEEKLSRLEN